MVSSFEPWWFYLWVIWGVALAVAVGWVDHSPVEAIVCAALGLLLGRYGMKWLQRFVTMLFIPRLADQSERIDGTNRTYLHWIAEGSLTALNPQRKPWETYPGIAIGVGVVHGLLIGPIYGAFCSLDEYFKMTAWQGAMLGCVGGPLFVCSLYAVATPILFARMCRGPSIEKIRTLVRVAADEADRLGHEAIRHEHLLIAIFRHPTGAVASLLEGTTADNDRLADSIAGEMPMKMQVDEGDSEFERSWSGILHDAIQRATKLHHKEVDPGHLLLAFLDAWPCRSTATS